MSVGALSSTATLFAVGKNTHKHKAQRVLQCSIHTGSGSYCCDSRSAARESVCDRPTRAVSSRSRSTWKARVSLHEPGSQSVCDRGIILRSWFTITRTFVERSGAIPYAAFIVQLRRQCRTQGWLSLTMNPSALPAPWLQSSLREAEKVIK